MRLGGRPAPEGNVNLAHDARAVFAVAAQLATEAGRPILAGRLWAKVYAGFFDHEDEAAVLSILIFLVGLIALQRLPVSEYPEVAPPSVVVNAAYPGASPAVIAA